MKIKEIAILLANIVISIVLIAFLIHIHNDGERNYSSLRTIESKLVEAEICDDN